MSKIVFLVRDFGPQKAAVVRLIREKLALSLSAVNHAFASGAPLTERKLFDRKEPDFPVQLLDLIQQLDALDAKFVVFELLENQVFSSSEKYFEINAVILSNMIAARASSLDQQRKLGELQDGD